MGPRRGGRFGGHPAVDPARAGRGGRGPRGVHRHPGPAGAGSGRRLGAPGGRVGDAGAVLDRGRAGDGRDPGHPRARARPRVRAPSPRPSPTRRRWPSPCSRPPRRSSRPDEPEAHAPEAHEPEAPLEFAAFEEEEALAFAQDEALAFADEEVSFGDFPPPAEEPVAQEPVVPEPDDIPSWDAPVCGGAGRGPRPGPGPRPPRSVAAAPVAAPVVDDAARTGRFAIGGFAIQPGQQALGGVSFRVRARRGPARRGPSRTPTTWLRARSSCCSTARSTARPTASRSSPSRASPRRPLGFTVRVSALASGPFAASGTFRIR